jgi:ribosomal protein L11 methyltransferase
VLAIDNDPDAVCACTENAAHNGVASAVSSSELPLASVREEFDVVVANILAVTLTELAAELLRITRRGGLLLLSGVLAEQLAELEDAFRATARAVRRELVRVHLGQRGDWIAVGYRIA